MARLNGKELNKFRYSLPAYRPLIKVGEIVAASVTPHTPTARLNSAVDNEDGTISLFFDPVELLPADIARIYLSINEEPFVLYDDTTELNSYIYAGAEPGATYNFKVAYVYQSIEGALSEVKSVTI